MPLLQRYFVGACALVATFALSSCGPDEDEAVSAPVSSKPDPTGLRSFTGAPTKVVWLEGEKWELVTNYKSRVRLMGLDTEMNDGAPRDLLGKEMGLSKPLIAPDGKSVIVSDRAARRILQVDWESGEVRDLAAGWASDVWPDPNSGRIWVYHRSGNGEKENAVKRFPLDDPTAEETVWTKTPTGHDGVPWTQLSADGKFFADAFPWRDCGMGSWDNGGKKKKLANGCWPGMSPDNSYRIFVFRSNHRQVEMYENGNTKTRRTVMIDGAPGQEGKKIYHPQWSNHPRFLSLSTPQKNDRNEIYIGRFAEDWRSVEAWIQVTKNGRAESFSDVWVASGTVAK
ncbi:MAG: hypothetical protein AAGA58_12550 [Verrucomicrobiota bacterium]